MEGIYRKPPPKYNILYTDATGELEVCQFTRMKNETKWLLLLKPMVVQSCEFIT